MRTTICLVALWLALAAGTVRADVLQLDRCTDPSGRVVLGELDRSLKVLVRAGLDGDRRVIRYNPDLLPNLPVAARQFFFAHECARLAMGEAPGTEPAPSRARHADCVGIATLLASGLIKGAASLEELQAELNFSDAEWAQLPGPRRAFDLTACPMQAGIALPSARPPAANQVEWNACIRRCSDRLFRCQAGCRGAACGDACLGSHDGCEATCKIRQ